tara:strand:+ start:202171 stop:203919 length:1749 start_codon:yes stop_codon:yes gene_type:complete
MSYQVLARKWRPKTFKEMVGQEHVLQALVNALDNDRLHHAYLFTGTRGVGKTTIARIFAKCLNCDNGVSSVPCGECSSCLEIAEGRCVDLIEVDAASRTKVEDTRELLENVQYAPTRSRYKVYLIDEVHMLSGHSFNALLKTLEEPPPHVKFLFATTDPQKLPATILSRCLQFNLKNMPPEQIVGHLASVLQQESVTYEEPALWLLGRAASGSMRDALSLTDQAIAFGSGSVLEDDVRSMLGSVDLSFVYQLVEAASAGEPAAALEIIARMAEHAPDFEASLDELISLLHRIAIAQAVPDAVDNSWGDAQRVSAMAAALTAEDTQLFYQVAINGKRDFALAPESRSGFEMVLLRMLAFRPAAVIDESVGIDDLEPVGPAGGSSPESPPVTPASETSAQGDAAPVKKPLAEPGPVPSPEPVPSAVEPPRDIASYTTAAPAASAAAQPAGNAVAPEVLDPGSWPDLLEQLGLGGIVYNIASHCELVAVNEGHYEFVLDERNASLFNAGHSDKIRQALEKYLQRPLTLTITTGAVGAETPAKRLRRLAQQRQAEAVASIDADPLLQKLIMRFDGELDRSSIASTE